MKLYATVYVNYYNPIIWWPFRKPVRYTGEVLSLDMNEIKIQTGPDSTFAWPISGKKIEFFHEGGCVD